MITFCPSQGMAKEKRHRRMVKKKSKYQEVNKARKLHGDLIIKARLE